MLIHEACRKSNLTKKAIEYYGEQGLISPAVTENGYRRFSDDDVARLRKIAAMRRLGLSVAEIRAALEDFRPSAMLRLLQGKELEIAEMQERQRILRQLAGDGDWEAVYEQMEALQNRQSVLSRILDTFPGGYGKLVCLHFAPFLGAPIRTEEQRQAFETIIGFLDGVSIAIPEDAREYLAEAALRTDPETVQRAASSVAAALDDPQKYIEDNRDMLERYQAVLQSEEYRASPAYRLKECLKRFQEESGYEDVFIPAMLRLSPAYREYYESLRAADEAFKRFCNR